MRWLSRLTAPELTRVLRDVLDAPDYHHTAGGRVVRGRLRAASRGQRVRGHAACRRRLEVRAWARIGP